MYVYAVIEAKYYMLDSSSSIIRRQRFLINNQTHQRFTTQSMMSGPALGVLRSITPSLDPTSHDLDCVSDIIKHARKSNVSIVIDGVRGQTLQAHKRLVQKVLHCEVMIKMFLSNYYCLPNGSPTMLGCISGSALVRKAALLAFENKRRLTLTGDIVLGKKFGGNLPSELI